MDISRNFCLVSLSAILAYMVNSIAKENIAATTLKLVKLIKEFYITYITGPRSAVGNVSGYRCVSDCRSRGREFDPGPIPYFRGD